MKFSTLKLKFLQSGYEVRCVSRSKIDGAMGMICPESMTIYIARDLSQNDKEATLLHELIHLFDETMSESAVESLGVELFNKLDSSKRAYLSILV